MKVQHNVSLKPYNSFKLDCVAQHFATVSTLDEFIELTQNELRSATPKKLIIGGGSNMLLTQEFYDGIVIKNEILGKEVLREDDKTAVVQVGAGENWDEFVRRALDQGYCGLENLVSIPGTVGAAPMQNIGAYGMEVSQIIDRVTGYDWLVHRTKHMPQSECLFGYRDSIFKNVLSGRFFITQVTFVLDKYLADTYQPKLEYGRIQDALEGKNIKHPTPSQVAEVVAEIRNSKLPNRKELGTAGSFFQNPIVSRDKATLLQEKYPQLVSYPAGDKHVKLSAGQLIELAGLKGYSIGDAGTYDKHALVIVNHGQASGQELVHLVSHIQTTVKQDFGVQLHPEVRLIN